MQRCSTFLPFFATLLLSFAASTLAQGPPARLHTALAGQKRVALAGSATPEPLLADDRGPVPDTTPLHGITLVFRRSEAQEADLQQLLTAQQNPASPEFHHWLTPEAFGRRFGVADADLDLTRAWLTGQGFTITAISNARDRITFSGTAGQVRAAFGTSLHHVQFDGEPHIVPSSAISLPAELAGVTTAVLHLSDLRPKPMARLAPRPTYTNGTTQVHHLSPPDLNVMYDLPPHTYNDQAKGQSIAVVGQSWIDLSLNSVLHQFSTDTFSNTFTPVLVPGTGIEAVAPEDQAESDIDLEYAAGIATGSNVFLVFVGNDPHFDVFDALTFAIDQNIAPVVSISYGFCETLMSPSALAGANSLFQQAALQGQTLVASAGDSGSLGCARFTSLSSTDRGSLAVTFPADSPYVTAVGGTQMAPGTFAPGASAYWTAAEGPADTDIKSLLSYVPEVVWNESSVDAGLFSTGGGASASLPRPSWQLAFPSMPAGGTRVLPDIALQASSANPGFVFCTDDVSFIGSAVQYCMFANPSFFPVAGGTSFAAPTFAGIVALLNRSTLALGQGNINPLLYQLAADPVASSSVFHDITTGANSCLSTIPGCSAAGQTNFSAAPGFDQATGLGSIDVAHLLAALPVPDPNLQPTYLSVSPTDNTTDPGKVDTIMITLGSEAPAPPATPPSGTLVISVDGVVVDPSHAFDSTNQANATATASYSLTAPSTTGSHIVSVTYPGDPTHSPATSATSVLVGQVTATGSVALQVNNVALPANGTATTAVAVTPTGGYNGRLLWSFSLTSNTGASLTACYQIADLLVDGNSTATLKLGAGTACSSAPTGSSRTALRTVQASTLHSSTAHPPAGPPTDPAPWRTLPLATGSALLLCLLPLRRRRPLTSLLCLLLLLPAAWTLTGCSGGGSGSGGNGGGGGTPTPVVNTYTGTLTARDSVNQSIYTSTTFTITVQ